MNSSKIRHWLAQASMTYYDVTRYVSDHPMIYHPVNVGKHQREMSIGDPVFIWRAKGNSKDTSGVIALAEVVETACKLSDVASPEYLLPADRGKMNDPPGKDLKVGLKIIERRVTPEEGMILRETVAAHPILGKTAIIKVGTGSSFALSEDRFAAYLDLWKD